MALSKFLEASDVEGRKYCPWSFRLIPSFKKTFELIYIDTVLNEMVRVLVQPEKSGKPRIY